MEINKCPICEFYTQPESSSDFQNRIHFNCPRCGRYTITYIENRREQENLPNMRLSAWIRERQYDEQPPLLEHGTIEKLLENLPNYSTLQKHLIILRAIESRSQYPGQIVYFDMKKDI